MLSVFEGFVDSYLARRGGSTSFGGVLDFWAGAADGYKVPKTVFFSAIFDSKTDAFLGGFSYTTG